MLFLFWTVPFLGEQFNEVPVGFAFRLIGRQSTQTVLTAAYSLSLVWTLSLIPLSREEGSLWVNESLFFVRGAESGFVFFNPTEMHPDRGVFSSTPTLIANSLTTTLWNCDNTMIYRELRGYWAKLN